MPRRSAWMYAGYVALALLAVLLIWQVASATGLLPGSSPTHPLATAEETSSGSGHMDLGAWTWALFILIATIALGAAIAWGEYNARKLTRAQWEAGEAKTREIYKDD